MSKHRSSIGAREQYDALLRASAHLEQVAGTDLVAGPTFWRDVSEKTRVAIVCSYGGVAPTPDYFETRRLSLAEIRALQKAYEELEQKIWRRAAELLKAEAISLKDELKRESEELAELVKTLEGETT